MLAKRISSLPSIPDYLGSITRYADKSSNVYEAHCPDHRETCLVCEYTHSCGHCEDYGVALFTVCLRSYLDSGDQHWKWRKEADERLGAAIERYHDGIRQGAYKPAALERLHREEAAASDRDPGRTQ